MADLIARPPLFRAWGLQLFTQVRDSGVVQWIKLPEINMTLSLRLDPFWQTYFLSQTRLIVNQELVKVSDVEGFTLTVMILKLYSPPVPVSSGSRAGLFLVDVFFQKKWLTYCLEGNIGAGKTSLAREGGSPEFLK